MLIRRGSFAVLFLWGFTLSNAGLGAQSLIQVDTAKNVSRADLRYDTPTARSEEGMPIGNGRMGTLVWTTPSALKMQINRVDVQAMDSSTVSFQRADSDYGYGCGFVDINVADAGDDVFTTGSFNQHLSLYEGLMTAQGKGVTARAVAWPSRDVIAFEIDDQRDTPEAISIDLRMLRYEVEHFPGQNYRMAVENRNVFRTANHTAESDLDIRDGKILLIQCFRELDYFDSSAVAISVMGRASRARFLNETTVRLAAAPGKGKFTILIASAANDDPDSDVGMDAAQELGAAEGGNFEGLVVSTAQWWKEFWDRGFVYMHSDSEQADFVNNNYTYFLYLMGASSRGEFPPRFGGMLWFTNADLSRWGSQHWFANTNAYYSNLMPSNRIELMDPFFKMYRGMFDACARAAEQQWGTKGIWIPETTFFNGPEELPEDIATELRDLMLVKKQWSERTEKFDHYGYTKNRHNSRWNYRNDGTWQHGYYVFRPKQEGGSAFGHTSHILGVAGRVGNLGWQRYQFTGDKEFLREVAYPIIKGAAEFYRNFPNLQKDPADGKYHINHTNSGESSWNSRDARYEVGVMHMIFPLAVRASEELAVDADMRPIWQEIKDNLVVLPEDTERGGGQWTREINATTRTTQVQRPSIARAYGSFVYDGPGEIEPIGAEPELKQRFLGFNRLGSFIDASGSGGAQIFRNRLRLREGPGAIDAEHIGGLAMGVHTTMLHSSPNSITNEEPILILDRWPKDWDAAFRLLARGGFSISSAQVGGKVPLIEIGSPRGGACKLVNPWGEGAVTLYRNGNKGEDLSGEVLEFNTTVGETVVVVPAGQTPAPVKVL